MKQSDKRKNGLNGHAVFFIVLAVILMITVIRLIVWNIGKHSGYDPAETTTEFDVELLDYILPLESSKLEGHEDDGVNTVLALGNDPFSDDRSENGLSSLMEKETGAVIYNCAFPGSTIAMKNTEYKASYPLDGLSLYWTVAALVNRNYDLMDKIVSDLDSPSAAEALNTLKSVDMKKVDTLFILYDLQDYMGGRTVYDESNLKNLNSVYGALNASIQLIQENYPYVRIYVLSHTYGSYTAGDGTVVDGDRDDLGNGTLVDYLNWELEVCRKNGVSFVDNYYGAVNMEDTDCLTDGFHLNEKGRQRVAERLADVFGTKKSS